MKTHTKPFLCNDCGKVKHNAKNNIIKSAQFFTRESIQNFSSKTDLAQHINHRHTAEELKVKPQCPVCSKVRFCFLKMLTAPFLLMI